MNPTHWTRRDLLGLAATAAAGWSLTSSLGHPRRAAARAGGIRDVVVVGGGLSGLMAAWLMSDHDVLLLERESEAGGRICTGSWNDFTYSLGAAYTGTPDRDMRRFFNELAVDPIPVPPPVDGMAYGGTLYPEDYFASALGSQAALDDYAKMANELKRMCDLGIAESVYGVDLDALKPLGVLDRYSMQQWLDALAIDPVVQRYVNVENRGLFGVNNGDFSLLYAIPELAYNFYAPGLSLEKIPRGPVPDFHDHKGWTLPVGVDTWTFPRGMMEVVDAMTAQPTLAGRVETGAEATKVTVNEDRTVTVGYRQGGKTQTVKAYAAVLATPAPVTAKIVDNGLSAEVMQALRKIRYTTYVTMALFMRRRLFRNAWNIACLDSCFTTLNDAVRTQVDRDYGGEAILGVAMPPEQADDRSLIDRTDDQLLAMALKDIEVYFPGARKQVLGHEVKRFEYAFPVFGPRYRKILHTLHNDPSARGPLFLAGDYTVYPTLGGAAVSGDLANTRVRAYAETLD